jgi:2-dehydropantoate 2-reductase
LRLLVAGAGAIGQWLGARLLEARHDVTLLTTARHRDAIAKDGLCVRGETSLCVDPTVATDAAALRPGFDAIVLTAKAYRTAPLAAATARLLAPGGVYATLQNGLGNAEKLARHLPVDRIAVATTSHGVDVEAPGKLVHTGLGGFRVGPMAPAGAEAARTLHGLLADAALAPAWADQMRGWTWQKAILNSGINPVGALHGATNGDILARAELRGLAQGLIDEAEALARRARVPIPDGDLRALALDVLGRTQANRNSMLQDVAARRPTETEQITGRLVRLGEKLLASMPRSDAVYGRMKDLESGYLGADAATRLAWDELPFEADPF